MTLLVFGFGYSAKACAAQLVQSQERLVVTTRSVEKRDVLRAEGKIAHCCDGQNFDNALIAEIATATTILMSAPPDDRGDPVLRCFEAAIRAAPNLKSIIYLSTIGVYGNFDGAWIDETTEPRAVSERAKRRILAENAWMALGTERGINTHILRLAGIYGPGRNALCDFANGTARRIFKENQVFNRTYVEDIALVAKAVNQTDIAYHIWNVCDNEPCPPQDVVAFAAKLLGVEPPALQPYETAKLTEMGRAFYSENKRVSNRAIRENLGIELTCPTYREGLQALYDSGEGRNGSVSLRQKDKG